MAKSPAKPATSTAGDGAESAGSVASDSAAQPSQVTSDATEVLPTWVVHLPNANVTCTVKAVDRAGAIEEFKRLQGIWHLPNDPIVSAAPLGEVSI